MKQEIYPGSGACELCGEVVPCRPCLGVDQQTHAQAHVVSKQDSPQEKINSISTSITKK